MNVNTFVIGVLSGFLGTLAGLAAADAVTDDTYETIIVRVNYEENGEFCQKIYVDEEYWITNCYPTESARPGVDEGISHSWSMYEEGHVPGYE